MESGKGGKHLAHGGDEELRRKRIKILKGGKYLVHGEKEEKRKRGKYLDLFRTTLRQLRENFEKTLRKLLKKTLKLL